jgi:hypothetical protein
MTPLKKRWAFGIGAAMLSIAFLGGLAGAGFGPAERFVRFLINYADYYRSAAVFSFQGIQEGERMPNLTMVTADGERRPLARLWKERPVILLTGSVTCPVSRAQIPKAGPMAREFGDQVSIAVLYTLEAHPSGNASPYRDGPEWQMPENVREGILRKQPRTLEERDQLAGELKERLGLSLPVVLDEMSNQGWKILGGGPNMAFLIDRNGIVQAKQAWFDAEEMQEEIQDFLGP